MLRWYLVRIKKAAVFGVVVTSLIAEELEIARENHQQIGGMRKIQAWNATRWIDTTIEDLPLGNNVIRVLEVTSFCYVVFDELADFDFNKLKRFFDERKRPSNILDWRPKKR